jgi:flagellar protein FlaG
MSITTVSMQAVDSLQSSHKTPPTVRAANGPGGISETPAPKTVAEVNAAEADKISAGKLQQSLEEINNVLAGFSISVQFQIDPDYKELIVKVVDQATGELIRQMPTADVVRISKAMDNLKGLLFAQSV